MALDVLFPHPVYAAQGWISVLNPDTTDDEVRALAERAHTRAAGRRPQAAQRPAGVAPVTPTELDPS